MDTVEVEPCGLLRLNGWSAEEQPPVFSAVRVVVNDHEVAVSYRYRTYRPDVETSKPSGRAFNGFCLEYLLSQVSGNTISKISIELDGERVFDFHGTFPIVTPHYARLLTEESVVHREAIYGHGPPARAVSDEVVALAKDLPAPIIDFGCGSGALVRALRSLGKEAFGVELQECNIVESLWDEARPFVTLYDGRLPLPYPDGAYESGVCTEVLEHVDNFEAVVAELARIIRKRLVVTVPDISAIPLLYRHNVVPWHLLEATHFNFFTQASLSAVLQRHFPEVQWARIGPTTINGTRFYTSLVGIAHKTR